MRWHLCPSNYLLSKLSLSLSAPWLYNFHPSPHQPATVRLLASLNLYRCERDPGLTSVPLLLINTVVASSHWAQDSVVPPAFLLHSFDSVRASRGTRLARCARPATHLHIDEQKWSWRPPAGKSAWCEGLKSVLIVALVRRSHLSHGDSLVCSLSILFCLAVPTGDGAWRCNSFSETVRKTWVQMRLRTRSQISYMHQCRH